MCENKPLYVRTMQTFRSKLPRRRRQVATVATRTAAKRLTQKDQRTAQVLSSERESNTRPFVCSKFKRARRKLYVSLASWHVLTQTVGIRPQPFRGITLRGEGKWRSQLWYRSKLVVAGSLFESQVTWTTTDENLHFLYQTFLFYTESSPYFLFG